jgi:pimeloyl-ACP methyl ester carboxylesterase
MHDLKAIVLAVLVASAISSPGSATAGQKPLAAQFPLITHATTDKLGRTVTYHLSRPSHPAPLLLMIQGSGCSLVLQGTGAATYSTVYDLVPLAAEGRFAVLAVEKPGAAANANGGSAQGCPATFNEEFTADRWLVALRAALDDARRQPGIDARRMLVLGASEGAVMASLLASRDRQVTDVIAVGGSGTTQLFDFLAAAYARCFNRSECVADVEKQTAAIGADPNSITKFAWGHPYRRWSSFFAVDPGDELVRSRARVYLAFGTADASTPPLSQEVAVAKLLAAGRDVTVRRVPDADHSLIAPGEGLSALDREYHRALDWFWAGVKR